VRPGGGRERSLLRSMSRVENHRIGVFSLPTCRCSRTPTRGASLISAGRVSDICTWTRNHKQRDFDEVGGAAERMSDAAPEKYLVP